MSLPIHQLAVLFPPPPQRRDLLALGMSHLAPLLAALARPAEELRISAAAIRPVSVHKLERNALSPEHAAYLALGRMRERLVAEFLDRAPDPTYGEQVARIFVDCYRTCRGLGLSPDVTFERLYALASAGQSHSTLGHAGALAILAYFFERCDIFEPADEESASA